MRARVVSLPTRRALITNPPSPFNEPPTTKSPALFSTGIDSPLNIDSSTAERPSTTSPSTGIDSPGRARKQSPTRACANGISSSPPSGRTRRAVLGVRSSKARIAAPARSRAPSSRICPNKTKAIIIAADSKYAPTSPSTPRKADGKIPGATTAAALKIHAAATPSPIKLNIFKLPVAKDLAPRSKNGQPHQKTTGVASANSIHKAARAPIDSRNGGAKCKIISGADNAQATSKRRRKSIASGFGASVAGGGRLSARAPSRKADNRPKTACSTCGCIGQVNVSLACFVIGVFRRAQPKSDASRPATNFGYRR